MTKNEQLDIMHKIADDLFGKDDQEPIDTIQGNVKIINNKSHTIAIIDDPDQKLPIIAFSNQKINPIGVSCSHNVGFKDLTDNQINYDFGDNITINANFYNPVRKVMLKHKEIKKNDSDYTIPNRETRNVVLKGKNVNVVIAGLNYDDSIVGMASMDEFNVLKKKSKAQLLDEIKAMDKENRKTWTWIKDTKEEILCNRIHFIKTKEFERK